MSVVCTICGGTLVVDADGQYATCQICGMKHSIEQVRKAGIAALSKTTLDKVGAFLKANATGASRDELDAITDELEPLYETASAQLEANTAIDPAYPSLVGMTAYALAIYYIEHRFRPDDAEKYALSARTNLKAYLDQFGGRMNDLERNTTKSAYDQSCEYAAFMAFYNDRFREVLPLLEDVYLTTTALALTGSALAIVANMDGDADMARAALTIFDRMDAEIKAPAKSSFAEDVYRSAYTYYALMLVRNAENYPGAGFMQDIPKAIYCLRRGISLICNEQFIAWLQEDLDEYTAML